VKTSARSIGSDRMRRVNRACFSVGLQKVANCSTR
jgi:hypothetical protein